MKRKLIFLSNQQKERSFTRFEFHRPTGLASLVYPPIDSSSCCVMHHLYQSMDASQKLLLLSIE